MAYSPVSLEAMLAQPIMLRPVVIRLPFATPSQNELARWHWGKKSRWQKEIMWQVVLQARMCGYAPTGRPEYPVTMEICRTGKRLLDYDNLCAGCKPLVDVLRRANLMHDDSPRWLHSVYIQQVGSVPSTTITIHRS